MLDWPEQNQTSPESTLLIFMRVVSLEGDGVRAAGCRGLQCHLPLAILIRGGGGIGSPAGCNVYFFPGVSTSPDGGLGIALDDHVIGEHGGGGDVRKAGDWGQWGGYSCGSCEDNMSVFHDGLEEVY